MAPDAGHAEELERRRLVHRAARLALVLARLEDRVRRRSGDPAVADQLRRAVATFSDELGIVRARLAALEQGRR